MEGELREHYEKKIQEMIREMEEEINTLEYKIEAADFDSDIGYKRPVVDLSLGLEEVKKAAKKAAADLMLPGRNNSEPLKTISRRWETDSSIFK